jgi:hypothetical protein
MPGGFGFFGAGSSPAGNPVTPPGVTPTTLVSSWAIDPVAQRYLLDAFGNPLAMDGTDQRVYVLVCEADTDVPVITPQTLRTQEAALRTALKPLVDDGSISGLAITATGGGSPAESLKSITYTNNGTNLAVTLKVR